MHVCFNCHFVHVRSPCQKYSFKHLVETKRNMLAFFHRGDRGIHCPTCFTVQCNKKAKQSRVEYFTTTVVNNLLYYLDTQSILT